MGKASIAVFCSKSTSQNGEAPAYSMEFLKKQQDGSCLNHDFLANGS